MPSSLERDLNRWVSAALIDSGTAERIRAFEAQNEDDGGLRWPVIIAVAFGAVLLGAGVLQFVSAHWDQLSPAARMALVVALVAIFHLAGAFAAIRFDSLSIAFHTIGTVALGAGIALTGQIFNLNVHWPAAILLWASGALLAYGLLRHWTQAALAAILIPYWLSGEWWFAMDDLGVNYSAPMVVGLFLLALAYLTARASTADNALRQALSWIGGFALLPLGLALFLESWHYHPSWEYQIVGWSVALIVPLTLSYLLRGASAVYLIAWAAWALVVFWINSTYASDRLLTYPWFALGAIGLIAWGVREQRIERINLGMAGFALVLLGFYFSTVMDKLGRSASLIGLGILFLAGGWILERTRRRLVSRIHTDPAGDAA